MESVGRGPLILSAAPHTTSNDIPVFAYFLCAGLIALAALDVARNRSGPALRWLEPTGLALFFTGILVRNVPVIALGALLFGVGAGINRWSLQNRR